MKQVETKRSENQSDRFFSPASFVRNEVKIETNWTKEPASGLIVIILYDNLFYCSTFYLWQRRYSSCRIFCLLSVLSVICQMSVSATRHVCLLVLFIQNDQIIHCCRRFIGSLPSCDVFTTYRFSITQGSSGI